jgi:hypothetical protein
MQKCRRCDEDKPLEDFAIIKASGNRRRICRRCNYLSGREKQGASLKAYFAAMEPNARRQYRRKSYLKSKYGLTMDQYDEMVSAQDGVCMVCRRPESAVDPRTGSPRRLAVDHCHKTGNVRDLLCVLCNTAIGKAGDDPVRLRELADYLDRHLDRDLPTY